MSNLNNLPDLKLNYVITENKLFYFLLQNREMYIIEFEAGKDKIVPLRTNENEIGLFFNSMKVS